MRRLSEQDLAHDADPERFGAAMLKCEAYSPACSEQGKCLMDGQCFASPGHLVAARMIEQLVKDPQARGLHFAYIKRAAKLLRAGKIEI